MSALAYRSGLSLFEGLPSFTQAEADLMNCFGQLFHPSGDWRSWFQEGLGALLETPGTSLVFLEQFNQVELGESKKLSFEKDEIGIGRGQDNDVVLALAGVGRHHARITKQGTAYFLEDLGSANGTYLNEVRLTPLEPVALTEGIQFVIFPYQFTFTTDQTWQRDEPIRLASGIPQLTTWKKSKQIRPGGMNYFSVRVSPNVGSAILGISRDFLAVLVERISRGAVKQIVPSDDGLFEFLMLSILERANRDLQFPFSFSLAALDPPAESDQGISLACVAGLNNVVGSIELFLPESLLQAARLSWSNDQPVTLSASWPLLAVRGHADLNLQLITDVEVGDVLLVTPHQVLLLPPSIHGSERGWCIAISDSDPQSITIEEWFERSDLIMENETAALPQSDSLKPSLATLPVRIHVVLSQLEMTLAELNRLKPGTMIELDRKKSGSVQLAVNGKIAGSGELVEIEGRLGVRIVNWAAQ